MPFSDATSSSKVTDLISTDASGKVPELKYHGGTLTGGVVEVVDNDVIVVTKDLGRSNAFTLYVIESLDDSEGKHNQPPFTLHTISATKLPKAFLDRHLFQALPSHLSPQKELHVLISKLSGTGLAPNFFETILQPVLTGAGLSTASYNVVRTENAQSVKQYTQSVLLSTANKGQEQTVIMLTGDGGIVDIINGLLESSTRTSLFSPPVLAQLPLGTGNALFHSLHRPSTPPSIYVQGLRTLLLGEPKRLPVFRARFSPGARLLYHEGRDATPLVNDSLYGAIVASYGLHSSLVADSDTVEYRKHGDKRFGLVANDLLSPKDGAPPHAYRATVTLLRGSNRKELIPREEHGYILATLVSNLEKTFTISPRSKPLDGKLRIVHFGNTSGTQTMEVMKRAYQNGSHIGMKWATEGGEGEVGYEEVKGMKIDFHEEGEDWKWRRCCIDGLVVGVEERGWMEVEVVKPSYEVVKVVVDM